MKIFDLILEKSSVVLKYGSIVLAVYAALQAFNDKLEEVKTTQPKKAR